MRVAVTGASGFVGTHLVERLLAAGHDVRVLSHRTAPQRHSSVELIRGGIGDPVALKALVANADAVVHAAGVVAAPNERAFHEINTEGTRAVGRAAAEAGVPRVLLISSLAARRPDLSAYAASKKAAEDALAEVGGLAWDAVRPPAIYGPGDRQVLIFFRLLKRGIGLLPAGDNARVSVIHVADLADAIMAWLDTGTASNDVYELADGFRDGYTWRTLIDAAARELTIEPRYMKPPRGLLNALSHTMRTWARLTGSVPFLTPDKLRELRHTDWVCRDDRFPRRTGWRPRIALGEGLRGTLAWYQARGWL
jgi:nucleoside-diphosphate-sugar epimerase